MKYTQAGLLAVGSFALGLVLGRSSDALITGHDAGAKASAMIASTGPGHPGVGERGLVDAVRTTLQMSGNTVPATCDWHDVVTVGRGCVRSRRTHRPGRCTAPATQVRRRDRHCIVESWRSGDMTADAWADYADALASSTSSLRGEPASAVAKALELEPRHAKALWLKASLEHEEQHYSAAVHTWETLLALVPQDSSDANIIRANIAEATRLAGRKT